MAQHDDNNNSTTEVTILFPSHCSFLLPSVSLEYSSPVSSAATTSTKNWQPVTWVQCHYGGVTWKGLQPLLCSSEERIAKRAVMVLIGTLWNDNHHTSGGVSEKESEMRQKGTEDEKGGDAIVISCSKKEEGYGMSNGGNNGVGQQTSNGERPSSGGGGVVVVADRDAKTVPGNNVDTSDLLLSAGDDDARSEYEASGASLSSLLWHSRRTLSFPASSSSSSSSVVLSLHGRNQHTNQSHRTKRRRREEEGDDIIATTTTNDNAAPSRQQHLLLLILPPTTLPTPLRPERTYTPLLIKLENLFIQLQTLNAWIATLGGGYFLCRHLSTAIALARSQRTVAMAMGDRNLAGRCTINEAYNYIHAGKIEEALQLIRMETREAKVRDDELTVRMCKSAKVFAKRVGKAKMYDFGMTDGPTAGRLSSQNGSAEGTEEEGRSIGSGVGNSVPSRPGCGDAMYDDFQRIRIVRDRTPK